MPISFVVIVPLFLWVTGLENFGTILFQRVPKSHMQNVMWVRGNAKCDVSKRKFDIIQAQFGLKILYV